MSRKLKNPMTLATWIWRAYLKTALIPVIIVQVVLFGLFVGINIQMKNVLSDFMNTDVNNQLVKQSSLESEVIDRQLSGVEISTEIFASQMGIALQKHTELSSEDKARLQTSPDGAYYTSVDNGGAAAYYSGFLPIGEKEREKVAGTLSIQSMMADIYRTNPLISAVFMNTYDSLNVIYPYVNVIELYTPKADITSFNFYYEADAEHNPERSAVWTDVYLDPAGNGWMTSSVAPVYNGDFLEGIVGIDVTVSSLAEQIQKMDIPGDGYSMLVDSDGMILALSEKGEADWGLAELGGDHYDDAIKKDTFKPNKFNLYKMDSMTEFAEDLIINPSGTSTITLGHEKKLVAWDTVGETGWQLVLIIPQDSIYVTINHIGMQLRDVGIFLSGTVILFYILFFYLLYQRSKKLTKDLSQPLVELNSMTERIGAGNYFLEMPEFGVKELRETSRHIVDMGHHLGEFNGNLMAAQTELKEKESYLKAVISSIDDAIVELDENGMITNLTIGDMRYIQVEGAREYTSIDSIFPSEKAAVIKGLLQSVIETGNREIVETDVETGLGVRWVVARVSLVSRDPVRVVVTVRDITERKEMEESISRARDEAEAASRTKSQFLSNMSHELRTPLNAVLGFAQVLEMDQTTPLTGLQDECVYEILKAGNHLLELINEVLDLAKIEAGKTRLSIEPVDIGTIIQETMTIIIPTAEKYCINVEADSTFCCHKFVKADKIKLKQVLINLLSNAIKYNKPNGKVDFYCEAANDKIRFHVVDTGVGIPEEELEEIFKPFYRLNSMQHVVEGTGVGLAVVKQLTEMMGGVIHVESTQGEGSHFSIELPAIVEMTLWSERIELQGKIETSNNDCVRNKKILYIEDNQANMRLVERVLELIPGTVFLSAQTAEQGIEIARREKPDVILLDINLPGMDGYEAFEELQEYEETENIPVIAVSSNAMEREIGRAIQMGFTDYITKPIKADLFYERIRRLFSREK